MAGKNYFEVVVNDGTKNARIIEMGKCGDENIESGVMVDINTDGKIVRCPDLSSNEGARVPLGFALKDYSPGEVVDVVTGDGIVINAQMDNIYQAHHVGVGLGLMYYGNGRGRLGYIYPENENARIHAILLQKSVSVRKVHQDGSSGGALRIYAKVLVI
jgi:hypothetical protein